MKSKTNKILVAYYTRTGNTRKVAQAIAEQLNADIDEITDLKDRKRTFMGWIIAGKDASVKNLTDIKIEKNPEKYKLVIIGTPVWAWTMTPAIRTYLTNHKFKNLAFFCTNGGQKGETFEDMINLSKKPIAELDLLDKDVKTNNIQSKIKLFTTKLK